MTPRTSERADPANQAEEVVVERRFPSDLQAAASARRALDLIGRRLSRSTLENAKLLVSELVTNAVRHGPQRRGGEVRVRTAVRPDAVRIDVTDEGEGFVQPPASGLLVVGGWGLVLVDRVADRWGIEDGGPTRVWFELDRSSTLDTSAMQPTELDTLQIALDAGRMGTWHWDIPAGTVRWSESLERIHGLEPGTFARTFEEFQADMHPEDRTRVLGSIEAAVHEGQDYAIDYRIVRRSDGAIRWLTVRGRVLQDEHGRPRGMAGVCADITERKEAERSLAVQYAVARVLSTAPSIEEAAPGLVEAIGQALGWEVGELWRVDEAAGMLRAAGGWRASGTTGDRFLSKSREFLFERGIGLPGRVWSTGRPVWIPDVDRDDNFPRARYALEDGLHAAFAFPITLGGAVLGVMAFFSQRIREPDEALFDLMSATGAHIGQYLERQSTAAELVESEARKSAVLESALEAIITMDAEGRVVELNAAAAEMFGHDRADAVGRELAELVIPPGLRTQHREALNRYNVTGESHILGRRLELAGMRADGSEFPVELTVTRVQLPDPHPALFTGYIRDITPQRRAEELQARLFESERATREGVERAHERTAFLADASMMLGTSLDSRKTLAKVAGLVVPGLADWCIIDMLEADGSIRSEAVHHADPDKIALAREYQRCFPARAGDPKGVPLAIDTREPLIYPQITDEMFEQGITDLEQRRMLQELGIRSVMIVPLEARGRALGAITFASAESGRTFGQEDLELALELARRAATAIDNARLYEERAHIARTLQKTLLPRRLPEIPGVEVATFYQPAGVTNEVGGDFYDVFEAGEHVWGVVVGDVCGKGVEAAALTGMARHTLRASALRQSSPRGALSDLNKVMLREDGERFCTVALGRIEANGTGVRLTVACGGHPSPLVLRGSGGVESIGTAGSLLGVFEDVEIADRGIELAPGDLAMFFTDGLFDPRHPTALGEGGLRSLVGACAGLTAQECVDRVGEAIADPGGQAPDDVCILVLRVAP